MTEPNIVNHKGNCKYCKHCVGWEDEGYGQGEHICYEDCQDGELWELMPKEVKE